MGFAPGATSFGDGYSVPQLRILYYLSTAKGENETLATAEEIIITVARAPTLECN